ncbi:MAG: hypothetical protein JW888_05975 [Pirellulales bacterium]|nr:hypothetical protein [Pirellulales bacterium]
MTDSPREDLLGYLLDALDEDRKREVEHYLAENAEARHELAVVSKAMAPLDATRRQHTPPADLADRTCRWIAAQTADRTLPGVKSDRAEVPSRPSAARMHPVRPSVAEEGRFRWQDVMMAAGIVVAASILLFPAIHGSRVQARLLTCQNHLGNLGTALANYSEYHEGFFPQVPTQGKLAAASAYAPILAAKGLLDEDRLVVCPGSPLAESGTFRIPSLEAIEATESPEQLKALQEIMGGSYGYCLGYQDQGRYRPTRNLGRPNFAIVSDAPSGRLPGHLSENHGRLGQNVLFEDGHVRFTVSPRPSESASDNFFLNDDGEVAAGIHQNDAVIGAGATPPTGSLSQ